MKFNSDFVFGAATAAYQCEGETRTHGKGKVAWDDYLEKGSFQADKASDFYHQYPVDLHLAKQFGIKALRISIAWSRIFPSGEGVINQEGVDFYHHVFRQCHKEGIEPYVTLHHFDTPLALHERGDFLNRETIEAFVKYAHFCFEEYKDEVSYWFTFNEVWPIATNQYIEGVFPPCITYDISKAVASMHGMMVAHAKAVNIFKSHGYKGKIGIIHSLETKYPYDPTNSDDIRAAKKDDILANQFLLDATLLGSYSEETLQTIHELLDLNHGSFHYDKRDIAEMKEAANQIDYLGMNYYQSHFVRYYDGENEIVHNGTGEKGTKKFKLKGVGERVMKEGVPTTDWDWLIYPKGMYDMLMRISKQYAFTKGIYITENGLGKKESIDDDHVVDDESRIDYIAKHLTWLLKAIQEGVYVKGYFVWSLMDVFSWSNGYNKRYGLFYTDYPTQKRYPKASAYWYKRVIRNREI